MNKKSYKNIIIYILTILFSILFIAIGYQINKPELNEQEFNKSYKAQVVYKR